MATITIKFKDELNYTSPIPSGDDDVTFNVTFICDNVTYSRIYINKDTISMSYDSSQIWDSRGWSNTKYQYITLDTNQTNFDAFITAMKDNIEGVLLESGTYKWVDSPSYGLPTDDYYNFSFESNSNSFTQISYHANNVVYRNTSVLSVYNGSWRDDAYKTITTTTDQYIDYDFYNYAILGNQLVKQGDTPTGTNKLKFGAETPSKLYIGESEVTKAYLGDVLIYEKGTSSGETWLLNESLEMASLSKTSVTFTSNNENFVSIAYSTSSMGPQTLWYYKNDNEYVVACEYDTYSNQAYRTITFKQPPTGDLLTWLQANGVKQ